MYREKTEQEERDVRNYWNSARYGQVFISNGDGTFRGKPGTPLEGRTFNNNRELEQGENELYYRDEEDRRKE